MGGNSKKRMKKEGNIEGKGGYKPKSNHKLATSSIPISPAVEFRIPSFRHSVMDLLPGRSHAPCTPNDGKHWEGGSAHREYNEGEVGGLPERSIERRLAR